jgi:mRNA guanylyltransferase
LPSCHKSARLEVAIAVFRTQAHMLRQRQLIVTQLRLNDEHQRGRRQFPERFEEAKAQLMRMQKLHPSVIAWQPKTMVSMLAGSTANGFGHCRPPYGGLTAKVLLPALEYERFFSKCREKAMYRPAHPEEDSEVDEELEPAMEADEMVDIAIESAGSDEEIDVDEAMDQATDDLDDEVEAANRTHRPTYGVPRGATGMPTFPMALFSSRPVGPRDVFDLAVPVVPPEEQKEEDLKQLQKSEASFVANGILVHNCEKSDGERAMLYISKDRQATFVIDRKFHVQQLKSPVYAEMWSTAGDTLIDGELVLSSDATPTTYFIAFDLILLQGERVLEKKLSERLGKIGMGIIKPYRERFPNYAKDTSDHPLPIRAKNFVKKSALHEGLMKFIRPLGGPHGGGEYEYNDGKRRNKNDGVIFTPENDDYNCKNVQLLKWKFPGLNTIDFMIRHPWFDEQGRLMLYSSANLASEREGQKPQTVIVHVRSSTLHPEKKRWLIGEVVGKQQAIVEMAYEIHSSSWQPKLFRWDKSSPNFMTTVIGTLETVMDNVQPVDLCQACGSKRSSGNPPSQPQQPQQHHAAAPAAPALSSSASSSAASHFGGIPADQQSFWSSGASAPAAASRATPSQAPPRAFSPPPAAAPAPLSTPSFSPFDTPMIDTSGPAPMATSKSISVFEQIASAIEVPVVETTRLFGD